jgi:hypothetical protein
MKEKSFKKEGIPMDRDYKIEVVMTPSPEDDNPKQPYSWCLLGYYGEWVNCGFGWAESPIKAWIEASAYFNRIKREKEK